MSLFFNYLTLRTAEEGKNRYFTTRNKFFTINDLLKDNSDVSTEY